MERRGRLMLVEDEGGLRQLVAHFLRIQNYEVIEAVDGADAVEQLDDPATDPLDLVLLDLNLPHVHGVDVARHLRRDRPHVPVIICSAAVVDDHEQALRGLGIRRFLTKPYHPEHLLDAIVQERAAAPPRETPARPDDLVTPGSLPLR